MQYFFCKDAKLFRHFAGLFVVTVGTMLASALTAITTFQMIGLCEYNVPFLAQIVVFSLYF
jgi:hypothetical protein